MEKTIVSSSDPDNVEHLKTLIERAHEYGVEQSYKENAEKL